ncbi:MAG TPA: phage terminase large subunit, partial [Gemmataceae bacterium]|nr:phage terminase large subunit [Gemmataceae bacterium]
PVTRDLIGRLLRGDLPCHFTSVKPTADKVARARLPAGRAEAGMVYADRGAPWFEPFVEELMAFPSGRFDDQVDALSGAVQLALEWVPEMVPVPVRWG